MAVRGMRLSFVLTVMLAGLMLSVSRGPGGLSTIQAQGGDQCERIAAHVLTTAGQACTGVAPYEICAGSDSVSVEMMDTTARSLMTGERMLLHDIEAVMTRSADVTAGAWGLAVLNLPATEDADARAFNVLLFGGARMTRLASFGGESNTLVIHNLGGAAINYRNGAGITYDVIGQLAPGAQAIADGRNAQGDWVRIRFDDTIAWVFTPLIRWEGDQAEIDALPVLHPNDVTPPIETGGVFQASTLSTESSPCSDAPSGLLLQTSGGELSVVVNQVTVQTAEATLLFTAEPGGPMLVTVLDGIARITAQGSAQEASSGSVVQVSLGGVDGLTPTGIPVLQPNTFAFAEVASVPLSLMPRATACHAGLPNTDVRLRVGPGEQRGEIGTMNPQLSYAVTGWANDSEGDPWWQLDTRQQASWVPQSAVSTVGACEDVPQVESPPIVLAPAIPEGDVVGTDLAPTTNSVWQMKPGTDNLVGQCSGAPAINFCDHLAAIAPVEGGLSWKGMEPSPYLLTQVRPGVYAYSGANVLGTGSVTMTMTFTSPTTLTMTMSLVLNNEPSCQHTYYYSGTRNW